MPPLVGDRYLTRGGILTKGGILRWNTPDPSQKIMIRLYKMKKSPSKQNDDVNPSYYYCYYDTL